MTPLWCGENLPPAQSTVLLFDRLALRKKLMLCTYFAPKSDPPLEHSSPLFLLVYLEIFTALTGACATSMLYFSEAQQAWNTLPY